MGMLNFSFYDWRRGVCRFKQAARGGIGTVFRHKKVKAMVLRSHAELPAWRVEENLVAARITPKKVSRMECPTVREELDRIIDRWHADPEYVIEMMQDIQERFRHIPKTALDQLQKRTGTPMAQLYHIATFYKSFSLEPRGETTIQVCMGTACHVKGAANILDSFERILGVAAGQTTADGKFTLEAVACLGACSIAPVVRIGEEIVGNVESRQVERLLRQHASPAANAPGLECPPEEVDHE
jgi:NADH-quinone oxidoreductase subunit E